MEGNIIEGKPVGPAEQALIDAYYQEPVKQAERFADLAKELFKLELAIPGIYASALRLAMDQQNPVSGGWVMLAFGLWVVALVLTLVALFPRRYRVLDSGVRQERPSRRDEPLSIEEYFLKSARYKRWLVLESVVLFFAGIVAAVWAVL